MSIHPIGDLDIRGVSTYKEADEKLTWDLPDNFNMGTALIDQHAEDRGKVAIFWENLRGENETITFWQLKKRCNRFGNLLHSLSGQSETTVGVFLPQRPETVVAHAGTWRAGGVTIPLPYTFETDSLEYRLRDSEAEILVTTVGKRDAAKQVAQSVETLEHILLVGNSPETLSTNEHHLESELSNCSTNFSPVKTSPEDDGIIIYTSGTTGKPKGAIHGHQILLGHIPGYQLIYNLDMEGVYYTPAGWGWGAGLIDLVSPALYYGQPVVAVNFKGFDPKVHLEIIEEYEITHSFMPPTALNMLRDVDDSRFSLTLEVLAAGGESLSSDAYEWAKERDIVINEFYGQTEANFLVGNCEALWESKPGSMGLAMPGREVAVIDKDGEELPPEETGEVALKNPEDDPIRFKRYLDKPEKTAEIKLDDWHLTEDLAKKDEEGYFWYQSRKDDVIISSGYRISPAVVEDELMQHSDVAEAAVIGIPDDIRGEIVKAYIKCSENAKTNDALVEELQQFVKNNLAKHEYPREIEFITDFPKTNSGKIRRKELRERN